MGNGALEVKQTERELEVVLKGCDDISTSICTVKIRLDGMLERLVGPSTQGEHSGEQPTPLGTMGQIGVTLDNTRATITVIQNLLDSLERVI